MEKKIKDEKKLKKEDEISKKEKKEEKKNKAKELKVSKKTEKLAIRNEKKKYEEKIDALLKENKEIKKDSKSKLKKTKDKAEKKAIKASLKSRVKENNIAIDDLRRERSNIGKKDTFLRDVMAEMHLVRWPSAAEMVKYSIACLLFIAFFALFFFGIDALFALVKDLID